MNQQGRARFSSQLPMLLAVTTLAAPILSAGPVFNFTLGGGIVVGDQVYDGFTQAAARWSSILTDNVSINVMIGYNPLPIGVLGSTDATHGTVTYSTMKSALGLDATSADDAIAVAHLQPGSSNSFVIN